MTERWFSGGAAAQSGDADESRCDVTRSVSVRDERITDIESVAAAALKLSVHTSDN